MDQTDTKQGDKSMPEFDATFIEKNKEALLEEMAGNINEIISSLANVIQNTPIENVEHDAAYLRNALIIMSQNAGQLASNFNQYIVFTKGDIPKTKPIGFRALMEDDN